MKGFPGVQQSYPVCKTVYESGPPLRFPSYFLFKYISTTDHGNRIFRPAILSFVHPSSGDHSPSIRNIGLLFPILIALSTLPCWTIYCIYVNYQKALKIGFPTAITPVDPFYPLWILARPYLFPFLSRLPFGLGEFTSYSYIAWALKDGLAMHARYGDAFTIVTPVENQVFVADAKACDDILTRRKDFIKKPAVYAPLDIFGRSVTSAEGETWQRHRKITTPPFSERNSSLVWSESVRQAREMLQVWLSNGSEGTTGTVDDTSLLALHVLTGDGFGMSYPFDSELKTTTAGHSMSYRGALRIVISKLFCHGFDGFGKGAILASSEKCSSRW
jgi:hypothetical protein